MYAEGALLLQVKDRVEGELREDLATLKPEESAVLSLLEGRLNRDLKTALEESVKQMDKRTGMPSRSVTKKGLILGALSQAKALISDGGCDSNRFRQTLADRS